MLSRRSLGVLLVLAFAARAGAQDDKDGLVRPERLTIGTSDQLLAAFSPDEHTLYYASNRNTTTELYSQDLVSGKSGLLFDEGSDVTWPRVSPDGKQLLYISFRADADGNLCVRTLPKGNRRCVPDSAGVVQASWVDAHRIVMLSRPSAQADMRISLVEVGLRMKTKKLFDRNLTSLAVSPDQKWLIYTPTERYVERIGPGFAATASRTLAAQRLDRPDDPPVPVPVDAPGMTGHPAFSIDGKTLFFVQFQSDSNHDGVIDANDHGTLFRIPFALGDDDAPKKLAQATPHQLTDASWNCQYPVLGATKLVATCERNGHLDAYGLPLTGVVPEEWNADRLRAEADVTTTDYENILLRTQILQVEKDPSRRRDEMVNLIRLHLRLDEFDAAEHYAKHVSEAKDPKTAGLGSAMRALCQFRRELRGRERGRLELDFAEHGKKALETLAEAKASSPAGNAARHIVRSEIADVLGDKALATAELDLVKPEEVPLPSVLELYATRVDALYRELDEREPMFAAYRALSTNPALSESRRITFAYSAALALTRGRDVAEAEHALAEVKTEPGTELAFAVELRRAVLSIGPPPNPQAVRDRLFQLYAAQKTAERRRAVMNFGVERAYEKRADAMAERLVELYIVDAPKGTIERRRAARLYRRFIEDRAYRKLGKQDYKGAMADFLAVAKSVGSLESWAGYLDQRLRGGADVVALEQEIVQGLGDPNGAVGRFVRAYLIARKLPKISDNAQAMKSADEGVLIIRGGWTQLKGSFEALSLMGALLHEKFLRGDRASALRASALYTIALDLAHRNPRYQAMLLSEMALLQAQAGNWRIAIDYFEQRQKLPFVDNLNGLTIALVRAQTLQHLDKFDGAAKVAEQALADVRKTPRMEPYHDYALDRAALYELSAGHYDTSLALYDELLARKHDGTTPIGARNRLVEHLARAAAALGANKPDEALKTLDGVEHHFNVPGVEHALKWPHATEEQVLFTYHSIIEGLRTKAYALLGRWPDAEKTLLARRALYAKELKHNDVKELAAALALIDAQLADIALEEHDGTKALGHAKSSLERIDPVVMPTDKAPDLDALVAMWIAAEARLATDAPMKLKLRDKLAAGITAFTAHPDKHRKDLRRWLEIELGMLGEKPKPAPAPKH